jgi:glycosyltransferase involved in cell wall biosynthesis
MRVTGFSFIRNAIKYDYPIVESIRSILPICDQVIVAVGNSEDNTLELIKEIDKQKINIIETTWDESIREGGKVLADETNKAFREIKDDSDWCFYVQGDEVMHEKYLEPVYQNMTKWKENEEVDGLLFNYLHFYGSYDYVGESYSWYRREIRVIRNDKSIYSYRDAQGFRKGENEKLKVKHINAWMYHYGWVKEPVAMQGKQETFNKLWHSDQWVEKNVSQKSEFDYSEIDALSLFKGTHPKVMEEKIKRKNWKFDFDISHNKFSLKDRFKRGIEKITGYRMGEYRNYKII